MRVTVTCLRAICFCLLMRKMPRVGMRAVVAAMAAAGVTRAHGMPANGARYGKTRHTRAPYSSSIRARGIMSPRAYARAHATNGMRAARWLNHIARIHRQQRVQALSARARA